MTIKMYIFVWEHLVLYSSDIEIHEEICVTNLVNTSRVCCSVNEHRTTCSSFFITHAKLKIRKMY